MSAPLVRLSRRSLVMIPATVALSFTLAACGGSGPVSTPSGTASSQAGAAAAGTVDAAHNDVDVAFVAGMTPHHAGAIEMSALATTRAASPEVKDLAARISKAQGPEIALMDTMTKAWQVDPSAAGHDMHGMSMDMGDGDAAALESLSGEEFDTQFLTRMIEHHEGALMMAEAEVRAGQNTQAKELAQRIVSAQDTEIAEMRGMLAAA